MGAELDFLEAFGKIDADIKNALTASEGSIVDRVGLALAQDIIQQLKDNLVDRVYSKSKALGSQNLLQSIEAIPDYSGRAIKIDIVLEDYYKFIDEGVGGAREGQGFIKRDANGKVISKGTWGNKAPRSRFKYKNKRPPTNFSDIGGTSLLQWANARKASPFAVRESIFASGIKPTDFFTDVIEGPLLTGFIKDFEELLGREIELEFG